MSWLREHSGKGVLAMIAGIALILLVISVGAWISPPTLSPSDPPLEMNFSEEPTAAPVFSEPTAGSPETIDLPRILRAREQYLEFSQYPPASRAYHDGLSEMIDWNRPIAYETSLTEAGVEPEIRASLRLDRMFAGPNEEITATLSMRSSSSTSAHEAKRLSVALQGFVEAEDKLLADSSGEGPVERVERVGFDPTDDPNIWEARFTPSRIDQLAVRPLVARFVVEIDLGKGRVQSLDTDFRYSADQVVSIYGSLGEEIVDGSLHVTLDAEVHRAGPVKVRGVLFDSTGERPLVTYSEYQHPAAIGRQKLTLIFFGKAIVDANHPGPYQVGSIHGILRDTEANPPEIFWGYSGQITTSAYQVTDFSAAEWEHPSKTKKLEMYEKLLSATSNEAASSLE